MATRSLLQMSIVVACSSRLVPHKQNPSIIVGDGPQFLPFNLMGHVMVVFKDTSLPEQSSSTSAATTTYKPHTTASITLGDSR
jgi:hypothetical protein